ncbi:hypothetical protein BKA70DRAFT_1239723 [Coprinopsis sp. MPI-PUGE-AT-0042]|nr:hypothetical protein BKA70DRAFT_1239723 [Coprinopsis sp. MPI-PUGE-AT-0042]
MTSKDSGQPENLSRHPSRQPSTISQTRPLAIDRGRSASRPRAIGTAGTPSGNSTPQEPSSDAGGLVDSSQPKSSSGEFGGYFIEQNRRGRVRGRSQQRTEDAQLDSAGDSSMLQRVPASYEFLAHTSVSSYPSGRERLHPNLLNANQLLSWISDIPPALNNPSFDSLRSPTFPMQLPSPSRTGGERSEGGNQSRNATVASPAGSSSSQAVPSTRSHSSSRGYASQHETPNPSASGSRGPRSLNPLIGGYLGHSCFIRSAQSLNASAGASNVTVNLATPGSFMNEFLYHEPHNFQVLPYTNQPPCINFGNFTGLSHNPGSCFVSFLGQCISSHSCNRRFHLRRHVPTGSLAFKKQGPNNFTQEDFKAARTEMAMLLPINSFRGDIGSEEDRKGSITLQAFHPGIDPWSTWAKDMMGGPHSPDQCTIVAVGLCSFSSCTDLQWYSIGAVVPSNASSGMQPEPRTQKLNLYDYLPLVPGD